MEEDEKVPLDVVVTYPTNIRQSLRPLVDDKWLDALKKDSKRMSLISWLGSRMLNHFLHHVVIRGTYEIPSCDKGLNTMISGCFTCS